MITHYSDLAKKSAALVRVADKIANDKELSDHVMQETQSALLWGLMVGAALGLMVGFLVGK